MNNKAGICITHFSPSGSLGGCPVCAMETHIQNLQSEIDAIHDALRDREPPTGSQTAVEVYNLVRGVGRLRAWVDDPARVERVRDFISNHSWAPDECWEDFASNILKVADRDIPQNTQSISFQKAEICSKLAQWLHSLSADSKYELVMAPDTPDQPFRLELAMRYALTAMSLVCKDEDEDECTGGVTK